MIVLNGSTFMFINERGVKTCTIVSTYKIVAIVKESLSKTVM